MLKINNRMLMRVLIVDDEPHAIEIIETYLSKFSEVEIVGKCTDAISGFQLLQQKSVDLIFLDIKMPGISGIEFLRSLKHPPKVIFTTAFSEYAIDGFELNAVDYLLKPISFERFLRAMDKVYKSFSTANQPIIKQDISIGDKDAFLYLKAERKTVKINLQNILWIESLGDYVKINTVDGSYLSKQKISFLEAMLPQRNFLRIHRSFIISINKLSSFNAFHIFINKCELPIGRNYKRDVQRRLKVEGQQFF